MYLTLSMVVFGLSAVCGAFNSVVAFRAANREAGWAWFAATMGALALLMRHLADLVKHMG